MKNISWSHHKSIQIVFDPRADFQYQCPINLIGNLFDSCSVFSSFFRSLYIQSGNREPADRQPAPGAEHSADCGWRRKPVPPRPGAAQTGRCPVFNRFRGCSLGWIGETALRWHAEIVAVFIGCCSRAPRARQVVPQWLGSGTYCCWAGGRDRAPAVLVHRGLRITADSWDVQTEKGLCQCCGKA